jgi:hypothetical protein
MTFPSGFVWGTAASAHQTEGTNFNSDWWDFEHTGVTRSKESSGDACDSLHRWPEDLDLVAGMNLNAYEHCGADHAMHQAFVVAHARAKRLAGEVPDQAGPDAAS